MASSEPTTMPAPEGVSREDLEKAVAACRKMGYTAYTSELGGKLQVVADQQAGVWITTRCSGPNVPA